MRFINAIFVSAVLFAFLSSACICTAGATAITHEETMLGAVVKKGTGFVIEADDGDYIVRGTVPSKFVNKLVVVSGIITESPKGDVFEITKIEDLADSGD